MERSLWFKFLMLIISLPIILISIPCFAEVELASSKKQSDKTEYFLIQTALQGKIEPSQTEKEVFTIILKKVAPYVSYFSDRPNREAGQMSMEDYLKLWSTSKKNGFKDNPPNAILHADHKGNLKQPMYFAFVLSNPNYDSETGSLSYQAKALEGSKNPFPQSTTLNHMMLFIDGVCIACW